MEGIEQLNMVDYSRQSALDNVMSQKFGKDDINVIVGCGGIGFWLGIQLAMLGYKNFILIDGETLDYSNLNRLPVPQTWVGQNKAVALRKMIRSMRLDTVVMPLSTHICTDTLSILKNINTRFKGLSQRSYYNNGKATVWDTTDDAKIQTQIHDYLKDQNSVTYRKLGYEGFQVGCYKEYSVWTADDYETGYRTSNANAVTSALSAGLGIFARCLTENDVEIDLKAILTAPKVKLTKKQAEYTREIKRLEAIIQGQRNWFTEDDDEDDREEALSNLDTYLGDRGLI